jgi:hypothetical protein
MMSVRDKMSLTNYLVWGLVLVLTPALGFLWIMDKIIPKRGNRVGKV